MIHQIKIAPCYFREVAEGIKTFEIRKNDRNYQQGDKLILQEYNGVLKKYTGREIVCDVPYIYIGGGLGLDKDYCILSITNVKVTDWHDRLGYKPLGENSYIKESEQNG